jgi:hypothetical protein
VNSTTRLQIGESRILSAADLHCLQLSRGGEEYVLSVANNALVPGHDDVMALRVNGCTGRWAYASAAFAAPLNSHDADAVTATPEHGAAGTAEAATNQTRVWSPADAFDDYAGAQVGDIVKMVAWGSPGALLADHKEDVPTYDAHVVGVSGSQLILVDMRLPNAAELVTAQAKAMYGKAAMMADRYGMPAARTLVDPQYTAPAGAGGRIITMIRKMAPGVAGGVDGHDLQPAFRWASGMPMVGVTHTYATAPQVASVMIHEIAHVVEYQSSKDRGLKRSAGWYSEAIAVSVEDMAARLATGHAQQAPVGTRRRAPPPTRRRGGQYTYP